MAKATKKKSVKKKLDSELVIGDPVSFLFMSMTHKHLNGKQYGLISEVRDDNSVVISDATLPLDFLVTTNLRAESKIKHVPAAEFRSFVKKELVKAIDRSKLVGHRASPGKLVQIPVADGYAWYVINRVYGDKCSLEIRFFDEDRNVDPRFGLKCNDVPTGWIADLLDQCL